jgi:F-type H+-transporting ATPase subunit b
MEILNQLGNLALGSVPTIIFFLLLIAAYAFLVRRPLERTLAERRARTTGAVEQAREAISAAEAETTAYENKLRAARAEIAALREGRLKEWQQRRELALAGARAKAQEHIGAARKEIEASAGAARKQIQDATDMLSEQIVRAVLPAAAQGSATPEGARS